MTTAPATAGNRRTLLRETTRFVCLLLPRLLTLHFAPSNETMGYFRSHAFGGWISYGGTDAIVLAVILIALAAVFAFVGARLQSPITVGRPGQTVSGFMIAIWALAICTFLVSIRAYAIQLQQLDLLVTPPRVQVGTLPDAAVAFLIILFLTRGHGWRGAFASCQESRPLRSDMANTRVRGAQVGKDLAEDVRCHLLRHRDD